MSAHLPPNQVPPGAIGFRLANELDGILQGIRADGRIDELERDRLARWLEVNEPFAELRPFRELKARITVALSDGVLTLEECDDLLFVTQKLTTVNPYFDALRSGIQVLLGLLAGIVANRRASPEELQAIASWSDEWSHLQGLWPFDEAVSIATHLINSNAPPDERYSYLRAMVDQFPLAGEYEESWAPPLIQGICAVDPQLIFPEKCYVFTGASARGERKILEQRVMELGGRAHGRVTRDVDYLIVCDETCPHWAFSCYGRKVEQAYKLRRDGHPIVIAHELDFWDALV
jgi:hypothetical protein